MPTDIFTPPLPQTAQDRYLWENLHGASIGLAISKALQQAEHPLLIIAQDSLQVAHLLEELAFFGTSSQSIVHFPDWETLPYDHFSPHQDIVSERLTALYRMPFLNKGAVITTIATLMQHLAPHGYLDAHSFVLKTGDLLNIDIVKTRLSAAGYHHVSQVREHGEYAVRGAILDLFPMGSKQPFRIDLLDNEVDSIRTFSPETQRSTEKIDEIRLLPAKEFPMTEEAIEFFRQAWRQQFAGNPLKSPIYQDVSDGITPPGIEYYLPLFFANTASLFDYLPKKATMITIGDVKKIAVDFWQEILMRYQQGQIDSARPLLAPEKVFLAPATIFDTLQTYPLVQINTTIEKKKAQHFEFSTAAAPVLEIDHKAKEPLAAVQAFTLNYDGKILFCAETKGRREVILSLFQQIKLKPEIFPNWQTFLNSDAHLGMVVSPIELGFSLNTPKITVLTETQLYGKRVMQRRLRKKSTQDPDAVIKNLTELQINDPVVHIDHGIGHYRGLEILKVGEQEGEFLALEYQGGDKLYVPIASLHLISRYTGVDPEHIVINKLGTEHWQRSKKKAADKAKDIAAELLDLYAKRASRPGLNYQIPLDYTNFANSFPFEETPDQLQAIEQVLADLASSKPMDRVICGDVGFGKTEVALRAAFIAVQNSKQVALLVPTTLLAQQHYQNFQDRFAEWPITVEMLSRFKSAKEQKKILERMAEGKVDIVIGTHKLLQADIQFKELGLVIIDEEHRFGVKQKERLKALRAMVDILTLTATPIPRTLNMSLSGIRDLSLIATPPARRLAVKTFVHVQEKSVIQEAILREILRGGQVYFLHNDLTTINRKADEIRELIKEARVCVAHGQMHEKDLERIMSDFYHRRFNVLVCSTIIESGIDIPTANTIIINRADKFGLAQLHQLRGRVGRSHHQAYAYLLIPSREHITHDAKKRLDAIASLDQLGIGFTLATHDLEIRGAGELLGEEQSGNMQEVGFSLYMDLLSRAVEALKHGETPDLESALNYGAEIDLRISALIPERYLNDVQLRLQFYKRIANAKQVSELDELQVEMIDRFGLLPQNAKNLFAISEMKLLANDMGILKIEANETSGKIEFSQKPNVNPETIIKLIQHPSQKFKLEGPTRLKFKLESHKIEDRINLVNDILGQLHAKQHG